MKLVAALSILSLRTFAATLIYHPSPYKGSDLWITNYYSYGDDYGVDDRRLRVGGWGDVYYSAIKFDLEGLPRNVTRAIIGLYSYDAGDGSKPVSMNLARVGNTWDEGSGWHNTKWMGAFLGTLPPPMYWSWYHLDVTPLYSPWKENPTSNQGLLFMPLGNNNQFNSFISSDHPSKSYRPFLHLTYEETVTPPNFKMPLPGGRSWVVTTEIGGRDALHPTQYTRSGVYDEDYLDTAHANSNYFSIDFAASSSPQYIGEIPIYAAAAGKVITFPYSSYNGNYIVIDHDYDGNEATGFTTRYLHLSRVASIANGDIVSQGQIIGYMGNTGASKGTHLHFGVRYNGSGGSWVNELSFVKLEGLPLKQYQTEIDSSGNRSLNSYFPSTNTQ